MGSRGGAFIDIANHCREQPAGFGWYPHDRTGFLTERILYPFEKQQVFALPSVTASGAGPTIAFDNSYARLPAQFYSRRRPEPVPEPAPVRVNRPLAEQLGIDPDWLASEEGVQVVAGNRVPEGADPIALVYAGHQFGVWNPRLGDGRALLLGEVIGRDGLRYDIQLKGSGPTPYSRGGDGKAPLGPVLREYIVSEAMAVLGIPTTRALAAVTTGEPVYRDEILPGAVLARVARSHVRIGTLQYFASINDVAALRTLVDYVSERHYPDAVQSDNPAQALLDQVIARQARLVARWQQVGFIHGVMNTDNMTLSGETIDYGPCAFMDSYHPETVFSSIDHGERYAYGNQPGIAHWNLVKLAQVLLPLLDEDREKAVAIAQASVDTYPELFLSAYREGMGRKLGLAAWDESDAGLLNDWLDLLVQEKADFTLAFRRLAEIASDAEPDVSVRELFDFSENFSAWLARWRKRLEADSLDPAERQARMLAVNPALIPRNHRVEEAIASAVRDGDFQPFHRLVDVLARPFELNSENFDYARPPRPEEQVRQTFCGT